TKSPKIWMHTFIPLVFFFQAEDGIRDATVTGVQTCALPISAEAKRLLAVVMASAVIIAPALIYGVPSNIDLFNHFRFALPFYDEIGRASCRERMEITVAVLSFTKQNKNKHMSNTSGIDTS